MGGERVQFEVRARDGLRVGRLHCCAVPFGRLQGLWSGSALPDRSDCVRLQTKACLTVCTVSLSRLAGFVCLSRRQHYIPQAWHRLRELPCPRLRDNLSLSKQWDVC